MRKIFVGNLSWKATEDELRALFESVGKVISVKIVTDQMTGRSKGFAFVEMESADEAQTAIDKLNNVPFQERNLRISLAQERTDRPPREGGFRSREGGAGGGFRGGERREFGGGERREFRSAGAPGRGTGGYRGGNTR